MKLSGEVRCVTGKNWLDFGGDPDHVLLGLRLQQPWQTIVCTHWVLLLITEFKKKLTTENFIIVYQHHVNTQEQ